MQNQSSIVLSNETESREFWRSFLKTLPKKSPCLFLFIGDVGAGKTTSLRWILESLGGDEKTAFSPTFSLHHRYSLPAGSDFDFINHFDLYRIQSEEELEGTGFWDHFDLKGSSLTVVEWAQRVSQDHWPLGFLIFRFEFQILDSGARKILWEKI